VQERRVDVRVIAATHRDLEQRVARGLFREDLLHRLGHVVRLPALRQRRADILPLFFRARRREKPGCSPSITARAAEALLLHLWHGNVRELDTFAARLSLLDLPGDAITESAMRHLLAGEDPFLLAVGAVGVQERIDLPSITKQGWEELKREYRTIAAIAAYLGCSRQTVRRYMLAKGVTPP
jgi:DNA-binding NtrC family response regulator